MERTELIYNDLKKVLEQAKAMGCKDVTAFHNVPLENIEVIIAALEKQIHKKSEIVSMFMLAPKVKAYSTFICPSCYKMSRLNDGISNYNYCPKCGQAIELKE